MKKAVLIFILFLLAGCSYHDGCFYSPQLVSCVDKGEVFPSISRYQKPYSLGRTDSNQRWKDVISCGGKYLDYDQRSVPFEKQEEFYYCMLGKGYIHLSPAKCGYQNPKWDKGVCNF
ncbi:hypothetical protein [Histophilus somni]|uniref:Lipoprotein n=1 Tax=Histophilus somni TaxID=731 RepID=A0AAX2RZX4_HISSO|nr:hypothetical protein [Histophilus somni]ACA31904.1 hypothetical protein HSM_0275 [Histophilus somni 2336]TDF36053.1 hypothetical protein E1290_08970 [Histophilus somni]TEW30343.1 hypothetical protein E2R48_04275 [Histophilus somni]TFF01888.1 hypothetical protein E3U35_04490 [Histophilus somni]THA95746.1 hypothetical protein E6A58_04340 [Histophilus somni]